MQPFSFLALVYTYVRNNSDNIVQLKAKIMEKISAMLDQFFGYFDLMATMLGFAIVFMIIANLLSSIKQKEGDEKILYVALVLFAAMFSAFSLLLPNLSSVSTVSVTAAFILVLVSVGSAFATAFIKKKDYYFFASLIFYLANVLTYVVTHA